MPKGFRHLVQFQRDYGVTPDSRGHATPNWKTEYTAYVAIESLTANEQIAGQQVRPLATHKITTHWIESHTVRPTWRIKYGDRIFHIDGITNEGERNRTLTMIVTEKQLVPT